MGALRAFLTGCTLSLAAEILSAGAQAFVKQPEVSNSTLQLMIMHAIELTQRDACH
jgi:hypothetical protein